MPTQYGQNIRLTCTMHKVSLIPADAVVTTWYFGSNTQAAEVLADNAVNWLSGFWNTLVPATGQKVAYYLSGALSRQPGAVVYDAYNAHDWSSLVLGPPFKTYDNGLDATSAGSDPEFDEVACVLSYHSNLSGVGEGSPAGPRPRARRRGRLYIGPIDHGRASVTVGSDSYLSPSFIDTVHGAALNLMQVAGGSWCQLSRTERNARQVTGGFVDNAADIQRRRGIEATHRVVFGDQPIPPP